MRDACAALARQPWPGSSRLGRKRREREGTDAEAGMKVGTWTCRNGRGNKAARRRFYLGRDWVRALVGGVAGRPIGRVGRIGRIGRVAYGARARHSRGTRGWPRAGFCVTQILPTANACGGAPAAAVALRSASVAKRRRTPQGCIEGSGETRLPGGVPGLAPPFPTTCPSGGGRVRGRAPCGAPRSGLRRAC
jgi:hypothetical protein